MRSVPLVRLGALCAVFGLLAGCHSHGPSPAYSKARATFFALYADESSDAYVDSRMDAVISELKSVPKDSTDAKGASKLLARIEKGRADVKAEQARIAAAEAAASAPVSFQSAGFAEETSPATQPSGGSPDAGAAAPQTGMTTSDFLSRFGKCFVSHGATEIAGSKESGTLYALSGSPACQKRFPRFQKRLVVAGAKKVLGTALASSVRKVVVDGGTRTQTADGGSR